MSNRYWPLWQSGYVPNCDVVGLGSNPRADTICVRECGVAFVRPCDIVDGRGAESWESEGAISGLKESQKETYN